MKKRTVYVFGSNEAGIHGAGTARTAMDHYGARAGVGNGLWGDSFAIPTKDEELRTLPLSSIKVYVDYFLRFAGERPWMLFHVTRIGCGLAGYDDKDMAPLFKDAPDNVGLPGQWIDVLLAMEKEESDG